MKISKKTMLQYLEMKKIKPCWKRNCLNTWKKYDRSKFNTEPCTCTVFLVVKTNRYSSKTFIWPVTLTDLKLVSGIFRTLPDI